MSVEAWKKKILFEDDQSCPPRVLQILTGCIAHEYLWACLL